ncbi:DUF4386 domain-containing protein [Kribbella sp. NBC_01245]|uniref:hypothetical protein n=1 Tax=Kribbella sp. NBC_01245 TaxID=2903578 RepID=UPI002E27EE6C|nr:hypothetical protein [Kribbella sp. NBC_01245]
MSTETAFSTTPETATRRRVGLLALALTITSITALPGSYLWPEPAAGGDTYTYADIAPIRDLWWGLLVFLSAALVLNVPFQALATMILVRRRGAGWATVGGAMMWLGTALYSVGGAGWAAAYYFATDPALDPAVGTSVMEQISADTGHLFGVMIPGALLVALGTVIQAVGLLRSRAVPRWIPILTLAIIPTFVLPGNGLTGALVGLPITVSAIALAYHAWHRQ